MKQCQYIKIKDLKTYQTKLGQDISPETLDVRGVIIGQEISEKLKYARVGLQYSSKLVKLIPINVKIDGEIKIEQAI